jgi:hypothetical protein
MVPPAYAGQRRAAARDPGRAKAPRQTRTPPDSAATAGSPARRGARTLKTMRVARRGTHLRKPVLSTVEGQGSLHGWGCSGPWQDAWPPARIQPNYALITATLVRSTWPRRTAARRAFSSNGLITQCDDIRRLRLMPAIRLDTPIDLEVDAGEVPVDAAVSFAVSFT